MALNREAALTVGLATATIVYGVHSVMLPGVTDVRVSEPDDPDIAVQERAATAVSGAIVAGISLLARDATVFIIGGVTVVALAWANKSANLFDPVTRRIVGGPSAAPVMTDGAEQPAT